MIDLDFENAIYQCTSSEPKNWQKVLDLAENISLEIEDKRRLSWVWPTEENLKVLQKILKHFGIRTILSIGCGCGLFEWILRESIGVSVFGLEKDRLWWHSNHAVKNFITLNFIEDLKPKCLPETFMQSCCNINEPSNWKFAIMFVYFNNRTAFLNYLDMYKGQWIILVGPNIGVSIHTDPLPLEPKFPNKSQWQLSKQLELGKNDVLAIYKNLHWRAEENPKRNKL